jgi:hypothetical protein
MAKQIVPYVVLVLVSSAVAFAQTATMTGRTVDPQGAVISGAEVEITNIATGVSKKTITNNEGIYVFPYLDPGEYRLVIRKSGFREFVKLGLILHIQDYVSDNFVMQIGSVTETMTVEGGATMVNTTDASVSTVVDRQFVGNMPLNGRSFQSLIEMIPGVVYSNLATTGTSFSSSGQFNINGQRADANYFSVDGVSANTGITPQYGLGDAGSGGIPATTASGGFNNLVSIDGLQEFRILTSSFAPEFGRSPGGQVSLVTRSGTNSFHGDAFEYLRNDVLDAADWTGNSVGLPKGEERQNDFGAVLGGPVVKDKLFFFFSYEGLRLRIPSVQTFTVPSLSLRSINSSLQPFFQAFSKPTTDPGGTCSAASANPQTGPAFCTASFTGPYTQPSQLDNTSIRMDYAPASKITVFGRYNHAPSMTADHNGSTIASIPSNFDSFTAGSTYIASPSAVQELRFNYTRSTSGTLYTLDTLGGAVPFPDSYVFPSGVNRNNGFFDVDFGGMGQYVIRLGKNVNNPLSQYNVVDSISIAKGHHQWKFGLDYRRLSPSLSPRTFDINGTIQNPANYTKGIIDSVRVGAQLAQQLIYHDLSVFAQDTWKVAARLTLTYGIRWELDPPPGGDPGFAVTPLISPLNSISLLPVGHSLYPTTWGNFAPRFGAAYQLSTDPRWGRVVRGGFGIFYDPGHAASASDFGPYSNSTTFNAVQAFPLANNTPPSLPATAAGSPDVADPNFNLPFTYQFNISVEQSLGTNQTLTASYVGAIGRRLLISETFPTAGNPGAGGGPTMYGNLTAIRNDATSDYHALQTKFQRRLFHGLQALGSFTWSHSIDTASSPSTSYNNFNYLQPPLAPGYPASERGPSDFDVRLLSSLAVSYNIPTPGMNPARVIFGHWGTDILYRHSGPTPFNPVARTAPDPTTGILYALRPDLKPSIPVYLDAAGCQARNRGNPCPGGKGLNPAAFAQPAGRQGDLGRNSLQGFPVDQADLALRRDFSFAKEYRLQFRVDVFNVLNHPNFANFASTDTLQSPRFGISHGTLAGAVAGASGFNRLYQIGGPRSIQLSLKVVF